ncbi:MAG: phosphogluconate dehydrogenase (NAD(+)-dependent, decarboxylating) [Polyangiaceae bacterium]
MRLGMIGLGRMGANMVRRLLGAGHECVVFDTHPQAALDLAKAGAVATHSLAELISTLEPPRAVWIMVPAAVVETTLDELTPLLAPGDAVIDGGNSYYHDDIRRAQTLGQRGIHYVDVGTSGGVWGFERGYCLMIGGESAVVRRLDGVFAALAPGLDPEAKSHGDGSGTPQRGYIHCGPSGAGHFVKMVHNGIEYGVMAAYAEGLNILHHANAGNAERTADAETAPLRHPELYKYDLNLADIAEAWRHGSVIGSWLLDLTAAALKKSPDLGAFAGRVSDSGEGRWTLQAAIDEGVPAPILSTALAQRLASRGEEDFANKVLSAMRYEFGGHEEKH